MTEKPLSNPHERERESYVESDSHICHRQLDTMVLRAVILRLRCNLDHLFADEAHAVEEAWEDRHPGTVMPVRLFVERMPEGYQRTRSLLERALREAACAPRR